MAIIEVSLSEDDVRELDEHARRAGADRGEFCGQLIRAALRAASDEDLHPGMTLDEIAAPVRRDFARLGLTEDELLEMIQEEREAVWQEQQRARQAK